MPARAAGVLAEVREQRELLPAAIDEAMRLEAPGTILGRTTTREIELRGVTIPAGAGVTLVVGSGNRDENTYERPDEFDLRREGPPSLVFGYGPHLCVGRQTATLEIREAIGALLDALPNLRLDPDADPPKIRGLTFRSPAQLNVVWD